MPFLNCDSPLLLAGYDAGQNCEEVPGFHSIFLAEYKNIDLDATTVDADGQITAYTMLNGETFHEFKPELGGSFFEATMGDSGDFYDVVATFLIENGSFDAKKFLDSLRDKCLVAHLFMNNCTERVLGLEYIQGQLKRSWTPLKFRNHVDRSGQVGTSKIGNDFGLVNQQLVSPMFATVGIDSIPVPVAP
jgi:hypothetical protein